MNDHPKTILIIYIHGFQGDDTTFASFPQHLSTSLSQLLAAEARPPILSSILYPAFPTRGSLEPAVDRFRAWLLEKVIDAEVSRGTPSPTLSPGVGVIICGHSMGGIVAAEACLGTFAECCADGAFDQEAQAAREEAVMTGEDNPWADSPPEISVPKKRNLGNPQPFPRLLGLLAFDTPYLGISPGVVRYGAEEHYREGKRWYDGASAILGSDSAPASFFTRTVAHNGTSASAGAAVGAAPTAAAAAAESAAKSGGWSWGKAALMAGASLGAGAAALAAGYAGRDYITGSYTWATEHLAFVGCLARAEELKSRVKRMVALSAGWYQPSTSKAGDVPVGAVGFANLYTTLDPAATKLPDQASITRTFCRLPSEADAAHNKFVPAPNRKAASEVQAHVTMFLLDENPQYRELVETSSELTRGWVTDWLSRPV